MHGIIVQLLSWRGTAKITAEILAMTVKCAGNAVNTNKKKLVFALFLINNFYYDVDKLAIE